MKKILFLSLLSASTLIAADNYSNLVVQILEDGTTQYLYNVPSSGSERAPSSIVGESIFQLHTTNEGTGVSYLLDEGIVNGYNPEVSITIESEDPNVYESGQRYSRAGRSYTVNYGITGILPDSEVEAAKSVIFEKAKTTVTTVGLSSDPLLYKVINSEGDHSAIDDAQMSEDASEVKNVYTFYKNVGASGGYTAAINSATVRVFPNASGNLLSVVVDDSGVVSTIDFGEPVKCYSEFPPIGIDVEEVYPGASVSLRIYPKGESYDIEDDIIVVTTGTDSSYSNVFGLNEVAEKLEIINIQATATKTTYVVELIEQSVFGEIVLDEESFCLEAPPVITINGGLIGSE